MGNCVYKVYCYKGGHFVYYATTAATLILIISQRDPPQNPL